jgi:hypothetical protein
MSQVYQDFRCGGGDFGNAAANLIDAAMDGDGHVFGSIKFWLISHF